MHRAQTGARAALTVYRSMGSRVSGFHRTRTRKVASINMQYTSCLDSILFYYVYCTISRIFTFSRATPSHPPPNRCHAIRERFCEIVHALLTALKNSYHCHKNVQRDLFKLFVLREFSNSLNNRNTIQIFYLNTIYFFLTYLKILGHHFSTAVERHSTF